MGSARKEHSLGMIVAEKNSGTTLEVAFAPL
jgi:hypothetical protein